VKVRPRRVSAVIAEQIVSAIRAGDYAVGSKLPPESELAEQMGVSRPSVREALSALQAVGVIESKTGSGSYVRRIPAEDDREAAPRLIESEDSCLEVMEARAAFEPHVAELAAVKDNPEAKERLAKALQRMRDAVDGEFGLYLDADKSFHQALAAATQNRLIIDAMKPLLASIDEALYREFTHHYYLKNVSDIEQVVVLHEELYEAVINAYPDVAAERMREHWRRMREIWEG
jgi:GntR family transcriptional repressor for pyruvate dehydrogenase complex